MYFDYSRESSRVLKRAHYGSLPNIHEKFLCEELDFNFALAKKVRHKTTDLIREEYFIDEEKQVKELMCSCSCDEKKFHCVETRS